MGAAILALVASALVACAQSVDVVNSLGDTRAGDENSTPRYTRIQEFSTTVSGNISSVTLALNFNLAQVGSVLDVYIYDATGSGSGNGSGSLFNISNPTLLGTITPTSGQTGSDLQFSVSGLDLYALSAGQDYAIVIDSYLNGHNVAWEYAAVGSANAGTGGAFNGAYNYAASSGPEYLSVNQQRFMDVSVTSVPEPSSTAFLGFGGMALIFVQRLRGKKS